MFVKTQNEYRVIPGAGGASRSFWIGVLAIAVSSGIVVGAGAFGLNALAIPMALGCALLLVKYPEVALGALMTIGSFKGTRELAHVPIDLTLLLLLILISAVTIGIWKKNMIPLPWEFWFYAPIVFMMLLSLLYTPHFELGLDKTVRFLFLTGICIISPFAILTSPARMQRFFVTILLAGLTASAMALTSLGGYERLTTPSGGTIQLGEDAALGIVIIWFGFVPHKNLPARMFLYALMGLMAIALVGSGSRGPFLGFALCILLSIYFRKKVGFGSAQLSLDSLVFGTLLVVALFSVGIPQASFNYLGQLGNVHDTRALTGGRADLIQMGLRLIVEHPLGGVGINGFTSEAVGVSSWPHNIPVEISCELGLAAGLSFCCLVVAALKTTYEEFVLADEKWRPAANMVLCFMVIEMISMLNGGNINEVRQMWTCISLPFVIRALRQTGRHSEYAG